MSDCYELGITSANLPLLDWIYEGTRGDLPRLQYPLCSMHPDTVAWLLDHEDCRLCDCLDLDESATASFQSVKRCLVHGETDDTFTIIHTENAIQVALADVRCEGLQWMLEHGRSECFGPELLNNTVRYGNVEAAKWLEDTFPTQFFNDPKPTFVKQFDS